MRMHIADHAVLKHELYVMTGETWKSGSEGKAAQAEPRIVDSEPWAQLRVRGKRVPFLFCCPPYSTSCLVLSSPVAPTAFATIAVTEHEHETCPQSLCRPGFLCHGKYPRYYFIAAKVFSCTPFPSVRGRGQVLLRRPVWCSSPGCSHQHHSLGDATTKEALKEIYPSGNQGLKFREAWEGGLFPKVYALLESMEVGCKNTDIVRIGKLTTKPYYAPVVLWIRVKCASLSGHDRVVVVCKCRELLAEHDITDVEDEIRESPDPQCLDVHEPLSVAHGLPVCGFEDMTDSQRYHHIALHGDKALEKYVAPLMHQAGQTAVAAYVLEGRIREMEGEDSPAANEERRKIQAEADEMHKTAKELFKFCRNIWARWATPEGLAEGLKP
ncbi:hypothetical protein BOTBODRAFT_46776 [Botryobasidium botryosum FD-172 SS1]|uniref:Uncharacterized protein n=1 Tax=Botryobasidium botryosum (strain FD-172 SS1) TaxID=930990 RepID=A0A067MGA0_BOTB1|nr:hypothetical protein BOTBODRAFT_46776 [Botryobasidium botryosum FD-172 SS1]